MHARKIVAALTAVALLASTLAVADNNVIDQGTYYKNAQSGAKTDANGNAFVSEASKDRDNWRLVPLLNTQLAASGVNMMDSTGTPIATYDFSRMNLLLKGNFDSLSTVVRVAVQIRGHWGTLSDSSAAYPWYRWPTRATSNGTTDIDSLGHMFVGSYLQAQVTTANQPFAGGGVWPGEFMVKFNVATQDSAGVTKYGAGPNTMLIPLCDASGAWFNAPYTSVRIRVLNGVRNRFKIRADLMGVSK